MHGVRSNGKVRGVPYSVRPSMNARHSHKDGLRRGGEKGNGLSDAPTASLDDARHTEHAAKTDSGP